MDFLFDREYYVGVVQAVPINVYDYYEPGKIKYSSLRKKLITDHLYHAKVAFSYNLSSVHCKLNNLKSLVAFSPQ